MTSEKKIHIRSKLFLIEYFFFYYLFCGKMNGWILVDAEGAARDLNAWFNLALSYVKTLPGK
jgi:hypothetical protein